MNVKGDKNTWRFTVLPLAAGLACAQVIATLFVRCANTAVYQQTRMLTEAGWFAIPSSTAADALNHLMSAIRGGLFFTLSIGAGLTLLTWAALHVYRSFSRVRGLFASVMLVSWASVLIAVNIKGPVIFPSFFIMCVPAATLAPAWSARNRKCAGVLSKKTWMLAPGALIVLTGVWCTQLNDRLFINIRDAVLLTNPAGRKVNDFYYRNTMFAAEAFRSFQQKTLRTCRLAAFAETDEKDRLTAVLIDRDILPVVRPGKVDMTISAVNGQWCFRSPEGKTTCVDPEVFLKTPDRFIRIFSDIGDRYGVFRRIVYIGLLIGFPCLLYVVVFTVLRLACGFFLNPPQAVAAASLGCLLIGSALFAPMLQMQRAAINKDNADTVLQSGPWRQKVILLRSIINEKHDISQYPAYRGLLRSANVAERYWLALALSVSRSPDTYADLLTLLEDQHPNVVCQTFEALGRRARSSAVGVIQQRLVAHDHWYVQWYGYRAMRRLGWRQAQLKQEP